LLYVEEAEVSEIETTLKNTIYRQNQMILFISMNSCILTIAVVICFCYNVAMSISRPLRKLIKIASMINNNATQKNRVSNIQEELPNVMNQKFVLLNCRSRENIKSGNSLLLSKT
jgi:sensor histidine kinase YesM